MKVINLSEQCSLLNHFVGEMRNVDCQTDSMRFRRNVERAGEIMAFEVSKTLNYVPQTVQTPLGEARVDLVQDQIVLATVLRAGLPFHQGFLNMFDHAENAFLSAYRRLGRNRHGEEELEIVSEYLASPSLTGKTLLMVDPMLASGLSLEVAYKAILRNGTPKKLHICCVIAAPEGVEHLQQTMPKNSVLWCAAIDEKLNEKKYIVPGLGDAGDLCFGEKLP